MSSYYILSGAKMRIVIIILSALCCAVSAAPRFSQRIVGGNLTTISQYPSIAALLYSSSSASYSQACGGSILTTRAILTAAHCVYGDRPNNWRVRVGSSYANSGGAVHSVEKLTLHSSYNSKTYDNDVAILRTVTTINYKANAVAAATIAGTNYNVVDNDVVWAAGWGTTSYQGQSSEQLRHVKVWVINQATCKSRYSKLGSTITENMLCSGWLDVGGRDQCQGDSGGPLYHNGKVVGIASWGHQCALASYPGVNTRVSRYAKWIAANS